MTRFATLIAVVLAGSLPMTAGLLTPPSVPGDDTATGIAARQYTGACQVMLIDPDGSVSYDDTPMAISHLDVTADGMLKAEFPDEKLKRGKWKTVTLQLVTNKPRVVWTVAIGRDTYKATAIPFSPRAYVFRLEITHDGKLVAGAQQFYAIEPQ